MRQRGLGSACASTRRRPLVSAAESLTVTAFERQAQGWLLDCEIRQLSEATLALRRIILKNFLWYLREHGHTQVDTPAMRAFFAYLSKPNPTGRWGNRQVTQAPRPKTISNYFNDLAALFAYLVDQGAIDDNPMAALPKPQVPRDQVQPFAQEQVLSIIDAARRSPDPRRNEALVLFLLDTGCRASEVTALRVEDLDLTGRRCMVIGKGNKKRMIAFGPTTGRAISRYLSEQPRAEHAPLFMSRLGTFLTRSGLHQIIQSLGKVAGVRSTRCSPHIFRHTFAVTYLRNGGDVFSLKELLGHTDLEMVNRYLALAQADVEAQHRKFSPVEGMFGRKAR